MKSWISGVILLAQFRAYQFGAPILPNGQLAAPGQIGNPWAVGTPGNPVYAVPVWPVYPAYRYGGGAVRQGSGTILGVPVDPYGVPMLGDGDGDD